MQKTSYGSSYKNGCFCLEDHWTKIGLVRSMLTIIVCTWSNSSGHWRATHARRGLFFYRTPPAWAASPWTSGPYSLGFLWTKGALLHLFQTSLWLSWGSSMTTYVSPGAPRRILRLPVITLILKLKVLTLFVTNDSGTIVRVFPDTTSWSVFPWEGLLWRLSSKRWNLSSSACYSSFKRCWTCYLVAREHLARRGSLLKCGIQTRLLIVRFDEEHESPSA